MSDIRKLMNIINETSAGAVASVAQPIGEVQKRVEEEKHDDKTPPVIEYGNWENSALSTSSKLKKQRDKSPKIVKSIYGADKTDEAKNPEQQAAIAIAKKKAVKESIASGITEETIEEQDFILNPASLSKKSLDLISKEVDRTDHEVDMARSDLLQAGKNSLKILRMIEGLTEEEGLEGWVQEKIIKAADYLNTVREYLEGKQVTDEGLAGAALGGIAGAALTKTPSGAISGANLGSKMQDAFMGDSTDESMDGVSPGTRMFTSEEEVEESGLQAYLGNKKYGKEGMDALRKAGREGASKEDMAKIRAKYDKLDEEGMEEGALDTIKKVGKKVIDVIAPDDQELLKDLQKKAGIPSHAQHGKPAMANEDDVEEGKTGPGLWANIHAKRERIKKGSGERMRKPGSKGAPTDAGICAARAGS